jgi:hypothetical protein
MYQVPMVGGYQHPRNSMSDMKLTDHSAGMAGGYQPYHHPAGHSYDTDDEEDPHGMLPIPRERRKRSCMDKVCCGCCVCCPQWARYCSCILLLLLLAVAIVIGVLAALFKMPQVHMSGLEGQPAVNITSGNQINMAFQLQISVDNPNVEGKSSPPPLHCSGLLTPLSFLFVFFLAGITFDTIVAKAYYPNHHDIQLGGGEKSQVQILKNAQTNFTFPFELMIDMSNPSYQVMIDCVCVCLSLC